MKLQFNINEALELIKQGARIHGKDGILAPLITQLTEAVLEAEIESHLSTEINNCKTVNLQKRQCKPLSLIQQGIFKEAIN